MKTNDYPRVFIVAAFLIALAAGLYMAFLAYKPLGLPLLDVVPPFAIALVLAFLLDPVVDWFQRIGMSRDFGVAIVGLSFIAVFMVLGFVVVPAIADQATGLAANLEDYVNQAQEQINDVLQTHKSLLERLHLPTTVGDWTNRLSKQLEIAARGALSFFASALSTAISKILWVIIIPLSTLWLLRDLDYIKAKVVHFTPERHRDWLIKMSTAVGGVFGRYVRGMVAVALIYSVVAIAVLSGFGLQYGLMIGAVSGFLYLVPYVGTLLLILATGVTALVQPPHSLGYAALLMGILGFQSLILFDQIITPKVVGGSVGVHPVLALFSLALGARMFGIVGMVAAVPVAAALQVAIGNMYPGIYDNLRVKRQATDNRKKAGEGEAPAEPG